MRRVALLALFAVACSTGPHDVAVLESVTLDCSATIDTVEIPPDGYTTVLDVVAIGGSSQSRRALQAFMDSETGWFGAKSGLVVRSGTESRISVPDKARSQLVIGWGSPGDSTWEVVVPACDRASPWIVFAGGFSVRKPACVPLMVEYGSSEATVLVGVGFPCEGQGPPP